ncbi:serine/threonine protein kinase [Aporhodopirellula aestuarii]|uniref:Serine/threonine protein kinase n=1 Tax=Aporhodopirellula aestuarii TaxID=2950107 RepID=A0ABT0U1Z3_9BACT|nr:serine/threonine-protein kinase [Aporhodopirellula aestuarii]MCM2370508.1 serine/threonine protein kinase [Aporhodopirellula aestuarii]
MTSITSERFVSMVAKSNLIDEKTQERFLKKVYDKCGGKLPSNPRKLATAFKRAGLLTDWHIEKIFAGKYRGFFLGKYKLLGHIGTGGMSSVYLAEHVGLHDKRAIKVLPKKRVHDASYLARFILEARAIASLNHPNIVLAHDIDNDGDTHYIVMEYVDGIDLQMLVRRDGPLDFSTAADLIAQAARGLDHAHEHGVIHRDVKPANLLIDQNGRLRLLDMGLALMASEEEHSLTVANNENVLGTADYLAPEQALNSHKVDLRVDIYGLGCTLYYLLTGRPPFSDGTLAQRIIKHQNEMPRSIRELRPDCPGELEGMCVKMLQKDPKYRYQTAKEVAEVFERFAQRVPKGEPVRVGLGDAPEPIATLSSLSFNDSSSGGTTEEDVQHDTVTGKNDETLASSRSKLIREQEELASSSGRLVKVQSLGLPNESSTGSLIDLEVESGYQDPRQRRRGDNQAIIDSDTQLRRPSANQREPMDPLLLGTIIASLFVAALVLGYFIARVTS